MEQSMDTDKTKVSFDRLARYRDEYVDTFSRTRWGRIWVQKESHVDEVKKIICEVCPLEEDYMGKDLVAVFDGEMLDLVYTHKFEGNCILIQQACALRGFWIVIVHGFEEDRCYNGDNPLSCMK